VRGGCCTAVPCVSGIRCSVSIRYMYYVLVYACSLFIVGCVFSYVCSF
jgi:hypothetical protein